MAASPAIAPRGKSLPGGVTAALTPLRPRRFDGIVGKRRSANAVSRHGPVQRPGVFGRGVGVSGRVRRRRFARARGHDEPVPFDPPRGSAYFRWVAEVGLQSADALGACTPARCNSSRRQAVQPLDRRQGEHLGDGLRPRAAACRPGTHPPRQFAGNAAVHEPGAGANRFDRRTNRMSTAWERPAYELLTLRPPFDGRFGGRADRPDRRDRTRASTVDARVPRNLETIVLKTLGEATGRPLRDGRRARRRPGEVSEP